LPESIAQWISGQAWCRSATDGIRRSENRRIGSDFFEVDAKHIGCSPRCNALLREKSGDNKGRAQSCECESAGESDSDLRIDPETTQSGNQLNWIVILSEAKDL